MMLHKDTFVGPALELFSAAEDAMGRIPPAWPLAATVAVNPYLGQADEGLAQAAARLSRVAGVPVTPPRASYAARIASGAIADVDLAPAAAAAGLTVADLRAAAAAPEVRGAAVPTVADLAAAASGIDWPALVADRIGMWAAGHFDAGQALWPAPTGGAWASWCSFARRDLTPEIMGLSGFAARVAALPQSSRAALAQVCDALGVNTGSAPTLFHAALTTLGGWPQLARGRTWLDPADGPRDATMLDLLTIRLVWEAALLERYADDIAGGWADAAAMHAAPIAPTRDQCLDAALQDAADRAAQRRLAASLSGVPVTRAARPAAQAAFCIDVRSEVFRRHLELVDPSVETIGFAGFFGIAASHTPLASDVAEARAPVLLVPGVDSRSSASAEVGSETRVARRAVRAWGRFRMAAVSSFAFVEAAGPIYAGKLVRDALGLPHATVADPAPTVDLLLPDRVAAAEAILRAMSLTANFARLVLIAGHGAHVVNAPFGSALQCGACGGYAGDVNARLLAGLLNDGEVRGALAERGIDVPSDTLFVAGLHDTVADEVTLYLDVPGRSHVEDIARLRRSLAAAGVATRTERALRLPRGGDGRTLARRGGDWAETRQEWGLAGCAAFVAAPRGRTAGRDLGGRAFLHSYDWRADEASGFGVLELILTAPVVVASWISLQYYGSTVSPDTFGAGNKLLHNVTGGIGVVEGNGGTLRTGLPMQSVHDGVAPVHEPLRLAVVIEAPRDAMDAILDRHDGLRALFDNGWLTLFAMNDAGRMAWRRAPDGWEATVWDGALAEAA